MPNPVRNNVKGVQLKRDEIISSSPSRFGRGGSAKFASDVMNHQVAISGKTICSPRAKIMVRLWVRS